MEKNIFDLERLHTLDKIIVDGKVFYLTDKEKDYLRYCIDTFISGLSDENYNKLFGEKKLKV